MLNITVVNKKNIDQLLKFLLEKSTELSFEELVNLLGSIESSNNYGTFFLNSKHSFLKGVSIHIEGKKTTGISLGVTSNLNLQDLEELYGPYKKRYIRYDSRYVYWFYDLFPRSPQKVGLQIHNIDEVVESEFVISAIDIFFADRKVTN